MSFVENLLDSGLSDCLGFEEGLKNSAGSILNWEQLFIANRAIYSLQMGTLRSVSRRLFMVLHIFLACRVPWVSPMATRVTINH